MDKVVGLKQLQGSVKKQNIKIDYDSLVKEGLHSSKIFREFNID